MRAVVHQRLRTAIAFAGGCVVTLALTAPRPLSHEPDAEGAPLYVVPAFQQRSSPVCVDMFTLALKRPIMVTSKDNQSDPNVGETAYAPLPVYPRCASTLPVN